MSYKPLNDETLSRMLGYLEGGDLPHLDNEDVLDLLKQARRANALAEAVERETSGWDDDNRLRAALRAYLGESEVEG